MKTWAVVNQKGGVGKTTTAVSAAGWMAAAGHRTLIVDLDPHGSMTSYFGYDPDTVTPSVYDLFNGDLSSLDVAKGLKSTHVENLYLLPAATAMVTLDRQLGTKPGMGLVLAKALATVADKFDYAFLDCPPMLGVLIVNALAGSDQLLIPVQTEFLAIKGLERMLHTMEMIERSRGKKISYLIVPTMFDKRTKASPAALKSMRDSYQDKVWELVIPEDTQFREASRDGQPISLYKPKSRGAIAYHQLVQFLTGDPLSTDKDIVKPATDQTSSPNKQNHEKIRNAG